LGKSLWLKLFFLGLSHPLRQTRRIGQKTNKVSLPAPRYRRSASTADNRSYGKNLILKIQYNKNIGGKMFVYGIAQCFNRGLSRIRIRAPAIGNVFMNIIKNFFQLLYDVCLFLLGLFIIFLGVSIIFGWFNANQSTMFGFYFIFLGMLFLKPPKRFKFLVSVSSIRARYKFLVGVAPLIVFFSFSIYNFDFKKESSKFNQSQEFNSSSDYYQRPTNPTPKNKEVLKKEQEREKERAVKNIYKVIQNSSGNFDVGNFCLEQERNTTITFEECIGLSMAAIANKM
jgi:hypothetical protein